MEEFDLKVGAQVFCTDGKCGKLAKYAVNPDTMQVTHLIVEDGLLLKRARVFPIYSVEATASGEIHLFVQADEVVNYPEYREEEIEKPVPGNDAGSLPAAWRQGAPFAQSAAAPVATVRETVRYGIPEEVIVIERGTPINGLESRIGKLDHFLVQAAGGEISRLVVQQGLLFTAQRAIPVSMVESIAESGISVAALGEELKGLPEYDAAGYESQEVSMNKGMESNNPAQTTAGDSGADLAAQVAMALFEDPRTSEEVIEVIGDRGVITLEGEVDDSETREAAEEVAAEQDGVISVVNSLKIKQ